MGDYLSEVFGQSGEEWKAPSEEEFAQLVTHCLTEGLTRQQIADELKISIATVSRWSFGESVPLYFTRAGLMRRLNALLNSDRS